jgi:hypothetical protein
MSFVSYLIFFLSQTARKPGRTLEIVARIEAIGTGADAGEVEEVAREKLE